MQPGDGATQGVLTSTSEIRACRWLDNETVGSEFIKLQPFPEKDADRVVVHIPLPHKAGMTSVTINGSTEGGDSAHNDAPTEINLNETSANSGIFESLPFVVVTDRDDDDAIAGTPGGADEAKNDRTHIGQAKGNLVVQCDALGLNPFKVPIKKNTHYCEVTSIILDVPDDDFEVALAKIKRNSQANWLEQAYKPYGIEVRHTDGGVVTVDATTKTKLNDILKNYTISTAGTGPNTDINTILSDPDITSYKTPKNIVLVYVNADLNGTTGVAVGQTLSGVFEGYILISLRQLRAQDQIHIGIKAYTAAHECGHALGLGHTYIPSSGGSSIQPPKFNLMRDGLDRWGREPQDAGKSGRRLLREQVYLITHMPRPPFLQDIQ